MTKHVAVLKGGLSAERDVSLSSAEGVSNALRNFGYKVTEIDVDCNISAKLCELKPDVVFNALHGTYGEDGCIQGVLEFLKIPYTHSGVLSSAVAMDKPMAKILFESVGITCPKGAVYSREEIIERDVMKRPYVVKPAAEGSSVGVVLVCEDFSGNLAGILSDDDEFLVEEFIDGRELTVGVLDGKPMGAIEINPHQGFYDYENKYTSGMTDYMIPAPVSDGVYKQSLDLAKRAHRILECRGVSRSDFRLSEDGELYMLELNTHPGMTPTSLVPKLAEHVGVSFEELVDKLVKLAQLDNA